MPHLALVAVALPAIGATILNGRVRAQAAWAFPAPAAPLHLRYRSWGLPFALTGGAVTPPFLLTLPVPLFLLSPLYGDEWRFTAMRLALAFGAIGLLAVLLRSARENVLLSRS